MFNTIVVIIFTLIFYLIICSATGLALGRYRFKGRTAFFSFILFFQIFPQMLIASTLYQLIARMGLINTWPGIVLAWLAYFAPFGSYIMTTYFSTVPKEILESAWIDNANLFQILFLIMMPVARPMVGTLCIIGALTFWGELPFSMMILQQNNMRTITLGVALMQGEYGVSMPILAAAFIVTSIIPFIAYLFFQNMINLGATAGSVKG